MKRWGASLLDLLCSFLGVMYLLIAATSKPEGIAELRAEKPWFAIVATITTNGNDSIPAFEPIEGIASIITFVGENIWVVQISGHGDPKPISIARPVGTIEGLRVCGELQIEEWLPIEKWESLETALRSVSAWGEYLTPHSGDQPTP